MNEKIIELFISDITDDAGARSGDEKPNRILSRTNREKPKLIDQYSIRRIKNSNVIIRNKNSFLLLVFS